MNCKDVRENLIELLAEAPDAPPADPKIAEHVRQCNDCAHELDALRQTMALMDEWEAPEPSPYFLVRLNAHVREEQNKAPARAGVLGWLRRPAMAVSLATVLVAGGLVYVGTRPPNDQEPSAVADLTMLDKNHD